MKKRIAIAFLSVAGAASLQADPPLQLSVVPDFALYRSDVYVRGFALNIWGQNPQDSFDLGVINGSTGASSGFSCGLLNYAEIYGGVQISAINYNESFFTGFQTGCVNVSLGTFKGFQLGGVNVTEQTTGVQFGAVNVAGDTKGLQLGAVNYADKLNGLQIGVINVVANNKWFSNNQLGACFPILNWSF
jgi:hypothetical protein